MSLRIFRGGTTRREMKKTSAGLRVQPATISSDRVDGHRSIILPSSFEADRQIYESNPTLLWAHDQGVLPVGMAVEGSYKIGKRTVISDYVENEADFSRQVYDLYQNGTLRGFSVGGYIKKYIGSWADEEDEGLQALPKHAREAMKRGDAFYTVTRFEHRETSACACPSNPDALVRAVANGSLQEKFVPAITRGEQFIDLTAELALMSHRYDALEFKHGQVLAKLDRIFEALCRKDAAAPVNLVSESKADEAFKLLKKAAEAQSPVAKEAPKGYSRDQMAADLRKLLAG